MSGHIKDERQYQFLDKCDTRLHKKINLFPHFFLEILQRVYKFVILGNLVRHGLVSTCRRVRCLSVCKKSTSSLPSFWDIAKTLQTCYFWVLRAYQTVTSKNNITSLKKTFLFIFMWKIIFIPHLFLEILQRYCKLVSLGTLGARNHAHQK